MFDAEFLLLSLLQLSGSSGQPCPAESGIYLMHNGVCVKNYTFFQPLKLQGKENGLQCLLANSEDAVTTAQGKWLYPDGSSVDCTESTSNLNPFACFTTSNNDGVTIYKSSKAKSLRDEYNGVYTCCLPGNCYDGNSSWVTIRIFSTQAITDLYVTLPEDITTIPQEYTVHCVIDEQCGCAKNSLDVYYYMEGTLNVSAVNFCSIEPSLLLCVQEAKSKGTPFIDNQLNVTWNAQTVITKGTYFPLDKPANGDHDFACQAVYNSSLDGKESDDVAFVSIRAPNFAPCALTVITITTTSTTIAWTPPSSLSDADGYVIHARSGNGSDMSVKVEGGHVSEYTLGGLVPNTTYTITLRAYQDILGPASQPISAQTIPESSDISNIPCMCNTCNATMAGEVVLVGGILGTLLFISTGLNIFFKMHCLYHKRTHDCQSKSIKKEREIEMSTCEPYMISTARKPDELYATVDSETSSHYQSPAAYI